MKTCLDLNDLAFPISLKQKGRDNFTVTYGLEKTEGLNYADAARKLGQSIMHALACNSRLDNREKGER